MREQYIAQWAGCGKVKNGLCKKRKKFAKIWGIRIYNGTMFQKNGEASQKFLKGYLSGKTNVQNGSIFKIHIGPVPPET